MERGKEREIATEILLDFQEGCVTGNLEVRPVSKLRVFLRACSMEHWLFLLVFSQKQCFGLLTRSNIAFPLSL